MGFNQILINGLRDESQISIVRGKAKAILFEEVLKDHYRWTTDIGSSGRVYETALKERINIPFEKGMFIVRNADGSIKFDDRGFRFDGYSYDGDGEYTLRLGPTHFGELRSVDKKAAVDEDFCERVMSQGSEDYKDERAYFANMFSVSALPITKDDELILFERSNKVELNPGLWDKIGGQLDPNRDNYDLFGERNASASFRELMRMNIEREFLEKMAIDSNSDSVEFNLRLLTAGVNIGFGYFAKIDLTSKEILERMCRSKDSYEHQDICVLRSTGEIDSFLSERNITPETKLILGDYLQQRQHGLI